MNTDIITTLGQDEGGHLFIPKISGGAPSLHRIHINSQRSRKRLITLDKAGDMMMTTPIQEQ
jgi:hypothetical protein